MYSIRPHLPIDPKQTVFERTKSTKFLLLLIVGYSTIKLYHSYIFIVKFN